MDAGGGISRRPLHFIILADCSGGMKGEKIQALNYAIADIMPRLAAWERDQEQAQVFIRAIAFATEPRWHIPDPQPVVGLHWKPLQPVTKGLTNMGPAFAMAAEALAPDRIERRALRPALLLVTDGLATDPPGGFEAGLATLMAQPAGRAALRLSIAIGRDSQSAALDRFIGDPSVPVLVADSTEDIADRLVAASLAVSRMSEVGADRSALARRLFGTPQDVPSRIFDQDTIIGDQDTIIGEVRPPGSGSRGDLEVDDTGVGGGAGSDTTGLPPVRRYLLGRFPDTVRPGRVFSLLVSVVRSTGAPLKPFNVPAGGRLLALIIDAPGLRVLDDHRQTVLVPLGGDSDPVKFDLMGDDPGPRRISVTAWDGGSFLGELAVEVSVERDGAARPGRTAISEAREERTDGEVTLLVRYDPHQRAYRFEFIDVDYPDEVTSQLVYDPGPAVERLVRRLNTLAEGTAGYSSEATRAYLGNEGVQLWQELVPEKLRSQFWERQRRITQLTILTNRDVVPWELLYPKDRGHDAGFLVEQFPVTRAIFGCAQQRRLRLQPARFVVPRDSPSDARAEAEVIARLLGTKLTTVSELMPLARLISKGRFGLLHFACHNRFDPDDGVSIKLDSPFSPTFLATAASDQSLAGAAPVVFINACRSLGQIPSYNKLDGWAEKFMRAGAAAFIGSLWEVSDGMAREFAQELYRRLVDGDQLGKAVMAARRSVAAEPGDPTWLAYAVYGDPRARVDRAAP